MADKYVPIFLEWLEVTQDLSAEEKGNLIDAVVSYAAGKEYEQLLSGGCRIAFRFLKGQVDRNAAISDVRRQARQGKRQQDTTDNNNEDQTITSDNKTQQNTTKLPKEKDKEKDKDKNKDKEYCAPLKRFTPPTVDEVREYCKKRGNNIDPEYFVDYYTARNWTLSNGKKVSDWRACVRTWEHNNYNSNVKKLPAQSYSQRDYSGEQEAAMRRMMENTF